MSSRRPGSGLTRRQWTAAVGAALPLSAQITTPSAGNESSATTPEKAAKEVREESERLAQIEVPMNTEPAFLFRA